MAASELEVKRFLDEFRIKMRMWGIILRLDRTNNKNMQALADLEITQTEAHKIIERLEIQDYCEGPLQEKMSNIGDMWVFGKSVKNKEIYIKVTMGHPGLQVICISFHIALYKMNYPLKNIQS